MATRHPTEFVGEPTLSISKVRHIRTWYRIAQSDLARATDPHEKSHYLGKVLALQGVLEVLYDLPITGTNYQGGVDMAVDILKLLYNIEDET